jgi:RNA polymerase sigma factor (sigma-70 family)
MAEASDLELLTGIRAGDREAWNELARRHAPRLAAYLGARLRRPSVVEKLVEDALVVAYKQLDENPPSGEIAAWLRKIAGQVALRWHREHEGDALAESFPIERCPDAAQRAKLDRLESALGLLTDAQRMALEQRYRAGLEGAALAEVLHSDEARAARQVDEALDELREAWKQIP